MTRLALLLFIFIGTTLAGSAMVIALATGYNTTMPVIISAAIGAVAGIPVSIMVAKALYNA